MTVIAYDGNYVAADRRVTDTDGTLTTTNKLHKVVQEDRVVTFAFTGEVRFYKALRDWWLAGAKVDDWPIPKELKDCYACLIVFVYDKHEGNKSILEYESVPFPVEIDADVVHAWGSGQQAALATLKTVPEPNAEVAVEIASEVNVYCGGGIDIKYLWGVGND